MSSPKKIVVLGDSICLPRAKGAGNIPYESTYPYLLDQALRRRYGAESPIVIECGMRSRTIRDAVSDWNEEVYLKAADIVIVQVGGNDCAPRVFQSWEQRMLERMPFRGLRYRILRFERKYRRQLLLAMPKRVFTTLKAFWTKVGELVARAEHQKLDRLILITIMPVTEKINYHLPGVGKAVHQYNEAFLAHASNPRVRVIDVGELYQRHGGIEAVSLDGMHINEFGHKVLAAELERVVTESLEASRLRKAG